jgi:hypothetical protein
VFVGKLVHKFEVNKALKLPYYEIKFKDIIDKADNEGDDVTSYFVRSLPSAATFTSIILICMSSLQIPPT